MKGMKRTIFRGMLYCLAAIVSGSCVYDFTPSSSDLQGMDKPLVVIEGDIIVGGITRIELKSTRGVLEGSQQEMISYSGSNVWVESEDGSIWQGGAHIGYGSYGGNEYEVDTRDLPLTGKYRLCVSVPDRGEYRSAFKAVSVTPQIDGVTYTVAPDRSVVEFEVTTHNTEKEPLYCRWSYKENWESNSHFSADLVAVKVDDDITMREITEAEKLGMTRCFSSGQSTGIFIANSEKLSENIISRERLHTVSATDMRISSLYCLTVTQTAMDKEAYKYWEGIKASVSGTGGLFAPMPNEVRGNIVCDTYPDEQVLGYVNVSTAVEGRYFFEASDFKIFKRDCTDQVYMKESDEGEKIWLGLYLSGLKPIRYEYDERGNAIKDQVYWSTGVCVDCRTFSNSSRPDFWPQGR